MSIENECMVVNLRISVWAGHRLDKEWSQDATREAGAADDAARVNKHLIPKKAFKTITSTSAAVRNHFYEHTLPWKDNGDRLLTRVMYTKFIEEHERLVGEFNTAVDTFLKRDYPAVVEQASFHMGDLFNIADYPAPQDLRAKFYMLLDIDVVTEAGDFRVEMDQTETTAIQQGMQRAMEERIGKAVRDVWERLADVVSHFGDRMADKDKIFRNATITNLEELVELLPALNVTEDPDLERLRLQVKAKLCGHEPDELRKDEIHRAAVAGEAAAIMEQMKGFMSAFGAK